MIENKELLEEAIKHFKSLQKRYTREHNGKMCIKVAVALEAMEKQIPKKPTMWGDGYVDGEIIMESYECPNCACIYDFDIDGKLKFCSECGQAILWEE